MVLNSFSKTFKAYSGGNSTITNIKYTITMNTTLGNKELIYNETYTGGNVVDYNNTTHSGNSQMLFQNIPGNGTFNFVNQKVKVEVTNSNGDSAFVIADATISNTVIH